MDDAFLGLLAVMTFIACGYVAGWIDARRKFKPRENVTPSCGCIMCDLKVERHIDRTGYYHLTQHGVADCTR